MKCCECNNQIGLKNSLKGLIVCPHCGVNQKIILPHTVITSSLIILAIVLVPNIVAKIFLVVLVSSLYLLFSKTARVEM